MKPFSAGYYVRNNKGRAAIIIFMMMLTTCMLMAGNYVSSLWWYYGKADVFDDQIVVAGAIPTDTDYEDWRSFCRDIGSDEKLIVLGRTGRGFPGMEIKTTIGIDVYSPSYLFNSAADMQRAFDHLGIDFDCTGLTDMSMVISKNLADNAKMRIGDLSENKQFTLRGIMDDGSYVVFYIYEEPEGAELYRVNVMSDTMSGEVLYDYVKQICGNRKVNIEFPYADAMTRDMEPAKLIFYAAMLLISVITAVTLNSVVSGQYIKREYEFGVYRALGISKGRIRRKIAAELVTMDFIAIMLGVSGQMLASFMMNELLYIPRGQYLPYVSVLGLIGITVSNLMVLLPLILLKGRKMCRMDVTEF